MKKFAQIIYGLVWVFGIAEIGCGDRVRAELERVSEANQAVTADAGAKGGGGTTSANLQLAVSKNACVANLAQDYFKVTNGTGAPVALSNLTIKYWVYDTSGISLTPDVSYGGCVTSSNGTCVRPVSGVTATATPFSPA